MIAEPLLHYVPGCENGDAPYSQQPLGGGKVNRSVLVRTPRGRFVVRLNEDALADPGIDRERELLLHRLAANNGLAPHVIYVSPSRGCLITEFVDGRPWTPHYFARMRDLRALGERLRTLHALVPPAIARFDPLVVAREYAHMIARAAPAESLRLVRLLDWAEQTLQRAHPEQRCAAIVHNDLHHGNILTADRIYFIDWEFAHVGDPLLDLACITAYYPRAAAHADLLLAASGLADQGATRAMLAELCHVFLLLNYLWYRARRLARSVAPTDMQTEATLLRRLLTLAPDA